MGHKITEVSKQFLEAFEFQGIRRRDFLKFCGATAALLGLPDIYIPKIAAAIESASKRHPVVWLNFASDSGCTEALIKATYPNTAEIILDILSLDYNETIMAAAGKQAEEILEGSRKKGGYILVVEGGVPTKKGHGMIAGKEMLDILEDFSSPAIAILAVGSCATFGGVPAAKPNPSQIIGVSEALEMFNSQTIHERCERRAHFDAGRFVESFGSREEALGYCLYKMGCKGPMTYSACPTVQYNDRVSWCIKAGAPCIGCAEHDWPDKFAGFYERLPDVKIPGIAGVETTADKIGAAAAVAAAAGIAAHAIATLASGRTKAEKEGGDK